MPATLYIPGIEQVAEQILIGYVSASLFGQGLIPSGSNFFAGTGNPDKEGPAVIASCETAEEIYWNSRVYRCHCMIQSKMSAADWAGLDQTQTGSMSSFAGNVNSLFGDSFIACAGINNYVQSSSLTVNFQAIQTQVATVQKQEVGDAWISALSLTLIAKIGTYP